jgi:hypothetical protein
LKDLEKILGKIIDITEDRSNTGMPLLVLHTEDKIYYLIIKDIKNKK